MSAFERNRVQGLSKCFTGNTIIEREWLDRVRFALCSTDNCFAVTGMTDNWVVLALIRLSYSKGLNSPITATRSHATRSYSPRL